MKNSKLAGNLLILTVTLLGLTSISQAVADPAASDVREIVRKASPSVVRVEVRDGLRRVATGVVYRQRWLYSHHGFDFSAG